MSINSCLILTNKVICICSHPNIPATNFGLYAIIPIAMKKDSIINHLLLNGKLINSL
jgi:hypothetical protein